MSRHRQHRMAARFGVTYYLPRRRRSVARAAKVAARALDVFRRALGLTGYEVSALARPGTAQNDETLRRLRIIYGARVLHPSEFRYYTSGATS